jgi:hypothetical protein
MKIAGANFTEKDPLEQTEISSHNPIQKKRVKQTHIYQKRYEKEYPL